MSLNERWSCGSCNLTRASGMIAALAARNYQPVPATLCKGTVGSKGIIAAHSGHGLAATQVTQLTAVEGVSLLANDQDYKFPMPVHGVAAPAWCCLSAGSTQLSITFANSRAVKCQ